MNYYNYQLYFFGIFASIARSAPAKTPGHFCRLRAVWRGGATDGRAAARMSRRATPRSPTRPYISDDM